MTQPPSPDAPWALVRALFDEAMTLPPEQRRDYVLGVTAPQAVRQEVLSLLEHGEDEGLLDVPAMLASPPERGREGERLGPWRLAERLGAGGMGDVWLARRDDGAFDGEAAIKVLKRGMDSAAVLARFAQEQQALARLTHPHIAHLLDAGRTADGLPYFVMERVQGVPIDKACEGRTLEQRLALFLQLADAVAHAHRNLLVHRDLKPSNVLVTQGTPGRESGSVKLLDFGIAKALDPLEGADGQTTVAGERPFTPHYASPEQVRGEPVSTSTDIYSLGVLLYVMLTGARPYGRSATTPREAARSVLEEEPTRPSALSPGLVADPQWMATRRRLRGDLDNILLKALDKTVARRYPSVDALAADVRAFLDGYPVGARPATWAYRARKFTARNALGVAAGSAAVLAVLVGAGVSLWQAQVAQTQRDLAERRFQDVRQFARTMLFDVDTALRDGPTAGREKLVTTALQYLDRLSGERLQDADLLRDVAEGYERVGEIQGGAMHANLGRPADAQQSLNKAMAIRQELARLSPDDQKNLRGLASAHERLGDNERASGRLKEAAGHYEQAAALMRRLALAAPDDLKLRLRRIEAERYLASVHYWPFNRSLGDYARARPQIEALAAEMTTLIAAHPTRPEVLEAAGGLLNQWSDFQRLAGEHAAGLATLRRSHALAEQLVALDPANPRWQRWLYLAEGRVADALIETGEVEPGLAMWRQSIARREEAARADPTSERAQRNVTNGYGPLAEQFDALGRFAEALPWYEKENRLLRQLRDKHPQVKALGPRLDESDRDLALQLMLNGRPREALALSRELARRRSTQDEPDAELRAKFALVHARVLLSAPGGQVDAAERAAALADARRGLATLRAGAAAELFNARLAREAATAAYWLGRTLEPTDPRAACALAREAAGALQALASAQRLPAMLGGLSGDARQRAQCAA